MTSAREFVAEVVPDALVADGFDEAIIGYVTIFDRSVVLYDRARCIDILARRFAAEGVEGVGADAGEVLDAGSDADADVDDAAVEAAEEYFEYNVVGSYAGEGTPAFAVLFTGEESDG